MMMKLWAPSSFTLLRNAGLIFLLMGVFRVYAASPFQCHQCTSCSSLPPPEGNFRQLRTSQIATSSTTTTTPSTTIITTPSTTTSTTPPSITTTTTPSTTTSTTPSITATTTPSTTPSTTTSTTTSSTTSTTPSPVDHDECTVSDDAGFCYITVENGNVIRGCGSQPPYDDTKTNCSALVLEGVSNCNCKGDKCNNASIDYTMAPPNTPGPRRTTTTDDTTGAATIAISLLLFLGTSLLTHRNAHRTVYI